MTKAFTLICFLLFTFPVAEKITISGQQKKHISSGNIELNCDPVKLNSQMKITEVNGDGEGFWIVKGDTRIHEFKSNNRGIGVILEPGLYYVYPFLPQNKNTAKVSITLIRARN